MMTGRRGHPGWKSLNQHELKTFWVISEDYGLVVENMGPMVRQAGYEAALLLATISGQVTHSSLKLQFPLQLPTELLWGLNEMMM